MPFRTSLRAVRYITLFLLLSLFLFLHHLLCTFSSLFKSTNAAFGKLVMQLNSFALATQMLLPFSSPSFAMRVGCREILAKQPPRPVAIANGRKIILTRPLNWPHQSRNLAQLHCTFQYLYYCLTHKRVMNFAASKNFPISAFASAFYCAQAVLISVVPSSPAFFNLPPTPCFFTLVTICKLLRLLPFHSRLYESVFNFVLSTLTYISRKFAVTNESSCCKSV